MPAARQYDRLVNNLEKARILEDGNIKPLTNYTDIDGALSTDIYDGIDYMCDYSECSQIKTLFAKQLEGKEKESRETFERNKAENLQFQKDNPDGKYRNLDDIYR